MNKAIKTRECDKVFLDLYSRLNLGCKSFKFIICLLDYLKLFFNLIKAAPNNYLLDK